MAKKAKLQAKGNYDGSTMLTGQWAVMWEAFIANMLVGMSQSAAYSAAGFTAKSPEVGASKLLRNTKVAARLAYRRGLLAEKNDLSEHRVLAEFARIGLADVAQAVDKDGNLLNLHDMPEDIRRAISGLEIEEEYQGKGKSREYIGRIKKVKFWDKPKSLELASKILGYFSKDNKQKKSDVNILITKHYEHKEININGADA